MSVTDEPHMCATCAHYSDTDRLGTRCRIYKFYPSAESKWLDRDALPPEEAARRFSCTITYQRDPEKLKDPEVARRFFAAWLSKLT